MRRAGLAEIARPSLERGRHCRRSAEEIADFLALEAGDLAMQRGGILYRDRVGQGAVDQSLREPVEGGADVLLGLSHRLVGRREVPASHGQLLFEQAFQLRQTARLRGEFHQ